jgi:hypothetical protein
MAVHEALFAVQGALMLSLLILSLSKDEVCGPGPPLAMPGPP